MTEKYGEASAISFTDGLNGQTTYFYHVQLKGLKPGTRYHYQVTDGAAKPSTAGSSFETAPAGRAKYRFSSYGDLCYANLDVDNAPGVWRDFGLNVARSAAHRPWMPALGNRECEFGTDDIHGHPGQAA